MFDFFQEARGNQRVRRIGIGQAHDALARAHQLFYAEREDVPGLIHPELARCAPIGLRLPFLQGNETIVLQGMNPAADEWPVALPGERPVFRLEAGEAVPRELHPQLFQLFIDADKKRLCLVWCARTPWPRPLGPGEDQEILAGVTIADNWTRSPAARR